MLFCNKHREIILTDTDCVKCIKRKESGFENKDMCQKFNLAFLSEVIENGSDK